MFRLGYYVREDIWLYERANTVMYYNDIIVITFPFKGIYSVSYGFLCRTASLYNPLQFGDIELVGVCLNHVFPTVDADNLDCIYILVMLKTLEGIDEYWLVMHVDKLLWDVLSHAVA